MSIPEWLLATPLSVRAEWAELYLLNRAVGRPEQDLVQIHEQNRSKAYRRELADVFESLGGGSVTFAGENALTLSAETARNLGFGREGPYRRDD
ncbi:hypothetical protein GCM10009037_31140 [Halarchaeum grantii]|uniref:Uncharacterized protein n=1 Tax=Halarchaeum grantii TaxID=1193105 RepID=A0A830EZF8_9EURY|nr:hypothetical protein GCM10009037_31140 [Halarchaeum grantii]